MLILLLVLFQNTSRGIQQNGIQLLNTNNDNNNSNSIIIREHLASYELLERCCYSNGSPPSKHVPKIDAEYFLNTYMQLFYSHYPGQPVLAGMLSSELEVWCWCKVLLPACHCWRQLVHSEKEDARVILSGLTYTISVPHADSNGISSTWCIIYSSVVHHNERWMSCSYDHI